LAGDLEERQFFRVVRGGKERKRREERVEKMEIRRRKDRERRKDRSVLISGPPDQGQRKN
jgi:hypothetical protein